MPVLGTFKIAVIGAGPAGLLAAHAVERMGHEPVIYAPAKKSDVLKAQCLWGEIPGLNVEPLRLLVRKLGEGTRYAKRLYGQETAETSWDAITPGAHTVWPLDKVYDELWLRYGGEITDGFLTKPALSEVLHNYPVVFCTAPLNHLCYDEGHTFVGISTSIDRHRVDPHVPPQMVMNGTEVFREEDDWFRQTVSRGELVTEFSNWSGFIFRGESGLKPVKTDCNCWQNEKKVGSRPRQLHRLGRFGKWSKGVQNHQAFDEAVAIMATEGLGRSV
jgi:hypothetical protein